MTDENVSLTNDEKNDLYAMQYGEKLVLDNFDVVEDMLMDAAVRTRLAKQAFLMYRAIVKKQVKDLEERIAVLEERISIVESVHKAADRLLKKE